MSTIPLKQLQQLELDIVSDFIEICNRNDLRYYALGGTLLGAVRHKGFIPWDDDMDIGMPRPDFEKFLQLAPDQLGAFHRLVTWRNNADYKQSFTKITDRRTKIIMHDSKIPREEEIWIDIFPLDGVPANRLHRKFHGYHYLYRRMVLQFSQFDEMAHQGRRNRPLHERMLMKAAEATKIESLLDNELQRLKYERTVRQYPFDGSEYSGNLTGVYKLREIVPTRFFGKGVLLPFETIEINCPEDYNGYLTCIYGENYMQIPKEQDRDLHPIEVVSLDETAEPE
ncbi:MAG: phosphorylcholine transferase LicD [Butyricicoccaceae bacterium]